MTEEVVIAAPVVKRKRGRPVGTGKPIGRSVRKVAGSHTPEAKKTMLALTHRLLAGSGDSLVAEIIRKALDPLDKDQAAMLKLCFDRMAPVSAFEKAQDTGRGTIELKISVAAPEVRVAPIENIGGGAPRLSAEGAGGSSPHSDIIDIVTREVVDVSDAV